MAYTIKFAQLQSTTLAGAGATIGDTSIILTSFKSIDGVNLAMSDFGSIGYGTLEPNNGTSEEQISFTGVTQNANGTATLTGVKHVLFLTPYTATSGITKAHAGGVKFVISNTSAFYQTIIDYIDGIAISGSPDMTTTTKGIGEEATAAEINAGTQTGGTAAELIVNPKYLKDSIYYIQLPSADEKAALAGTGTPSASNKYVTADAIPGYATGPIVRTYLTGASPATWTKPANLKYVIVEVQAGGGGGGGASTDQGRGGGGAGGYSRKLILAASLGATETVTIGAGGGGGSAGSNGSNGGNSSFGTHATANGGSANSGQTGGNGGTAASGDINVSGGGGGAGVGDIAAGACFSGMGGNSVLGGGGAGQFGTGGGAFGVAGGGYGSGGSGGATTSTNTTTGGAGAAGIVIVTEYYI